MKWFIIISVFILVLIGHFLYITQDSGIASKNGQWASYRFEQNPESRFDRYVAPGEYWLGFSYGLAGAFATFSLFRVIWNRGGSFAVSVKGLTISGLLWASVCFFVGCCGSPMLPVYLGLLGPKFLGVTKPLTFALTSISITISYIFIIKRRANKCECKECQH